MYFAGRLGRKAWINKTAPTLHLCTTFPQFKLRTMNPKRHAQPLECSRQPMVD